jgi:crotonobetainyl-CoA:carnitine CoA-transferase CaiB-like acyl-CoA transferase
MGAEVIKIETPEHGDDARYQGVVVKGESGYFVGMNRNKKGLTIIHSVKIVITCRS